MESLPETYEDLPDKRRFWPAPAGSEEEGLGMLRLLTPDIVAAAARAEIQTGERVCLNWDLDKLDPPGQLQQNLNYYVIPVYQWTGFGRRKFEHVIKWVNKGIAFDDEYHFNPQQSSQWDGLRHHGAPSADGRKKLWYGGTTPEEILDPKSNRIGLGFWARKGIAGRGVLIDYLSWAERRGITVNALTQHVVSLDDVLEIAKECKIEFQRADIFFLRVGLTKTWDAMMDAQKQAYGRLDPPKHAGIEQSERVVRFFWNSHFAAVASDAVSFEVFPAIQEEWDLHHHLLAGWGMPIGEMFDLEELAALCQKLGRWSFFISSSPLKFANGVSSPPNCMAIF
ncbi:hypothetical protein Egran_05772 [Elaphomyces granulatus]|uniref:Cyclase n=1 Tax=Elaphomyces granulatus TaxID=519963 RepID=A0A232LQM0_9EURO|nr:hypothetical protein Egran_05772 [Elaphomyces granulatus]